MDYINKLNFDANTSRNITKIISEIEKFQGYWSAAPVVNPEYLHELRHIATIQSIGSSTRIEGSELRDHDVSELIANMSINQLETRDDQEVVGYWEALTTLLENAEDIDLSERYIFQLHGLLLRYSTKDDAQRGQYKNITNRVVARYPDGSEKTIFRTTEPHLVKVEMERLLEWIKQELANQEIHPLVVIALFVYEFLSIHPFHDGNGRLSRLLTTLLLVRCDYRFVQYVSFEHVIEERKKDYYKILMACQAKRYTDDEIIGEWVVFFLTCIATLTAKLRAKIPKLTTNAKHVSKRQERILEIINHRASTKISDLQLHINVSLASLKRDISYLHENGFIVREGVGKATVYKVKII